MPEEETETKKSKVPNALMMFLVLGLTMNTLLSYTQTSTIQDTTAARAVVGDEVLKNSQENKENILLMLKQIEELKIKIDSIEKTGKVVR